MAKDKLGSVVLKTDRFPPKKTIGRFLIMSKSLMNPGDLARSYFWAWFIAGCVKTCYPTNIIMIEFLTNLNQTACSWYKMYNIQIFFRAGVEELYLWGFFFRHLQDTRSDDSNRLWPNGSCSECKLWFISLWPILGWPTRLHFRSENIHRHQQQSLPWSAEKQPIDLYWVGFGISCCNVVFDLLGHLCKRTAAPCLY